jgi:hypothetical protein
MMVKNCLKVLALAFLHIGAAAAARGSRDAGAAAEIDAYPAWRAAAVHILAARADAHSLAAAAALAYVGPASRPKTEVMKAASTALDFAVKASELAPADTAISWLRLHLCANAVACDLREAATTMRWVDADNAAAWLPTLATAQRDRDAVEVNRVLVAMANESRFDLYGNITIVRIYDALKRVRGQLPGNYAKSDLARLTEAMGVADDAVTPSFSPLINACREDAAERRESCLKLSKTLQRADAVLAQLVGFAIERRLTPSDGKEQRLLAERRRVLEWRLASANLSDSPLLPWLQNARARARLAIIRAMPREEDACSAIVRSHGMPLNPPEDHR